MGRGRRRKSQRGFTLIEMLVVIGIILFLAGMIAVAALRTMAGTKQKNTKALLNRIAISLEHFKVEPGNSRQYPVALNKAGSPSLYEALRKYDAWTPQQVYGGKFVDAWGNKIQYYPKIMDGGLADGTNGPVVRFKLWSPGEDTKTGQPTAVAADSTGNAADSRDDLEPDG